jgi:hypothetical protein
MNIAKYFFLAADLIDEVKPAERSKTIIPGMGDAFFIIGICLLLGIAVLFWVVFLRKGSKNRTALHTKTSSGSRKRKRKERYTHRNPTLAETGGLPPIREEGPDNNPPS